MQAVQVGRSVQFDNFPAELRSRDNWLLWRAERSRKVPYQPHNPTHRAKSTNAATWASFGTAQAAYDPSRDSGLGFALDGSGQACIDIDGDTSERAVRLLHDAGCGYIEYSPSGNGLHGWGYHRGELPRKKGVIDSISVEIYNSARYMSVTGNVIFSGPFSELHGLGELSKTLVTPCATQEYTGELRSTQGILRNTQVRLAPSSFDDDAIARFIPPTAGTRNKYLFALARHLKACIPDASKAELREIVKRWHRLALPAIETTEFSESWSDFLRGWEKVRIPEGDVLRYILNGVDDDPLPDGAPDDCGANTSLLIKICQRLQRHAGDEPFFISSRTAGDLLGIHYTRAANILRGLMADDVIKLVERGKLKGRQASQYRFIGGISEPVSRSDGKG